MSVCLILAKSVKKGNMLIYLSCIASYSTSVIFKTFWKMVSCYFFVVIRVGKEPDLNKKVGWGLQPLFTFGRLLIFCTFYVSCSPGMYGVRIWMTDWTIPAVSNMEEKLTQTTPQNTSCTH